MNQMTVQNVSCVGDGGNSIFINYDSNNTKKQLLIDGILFKNITTNGSIIKIRGNDSNIIIKNSKFINNTSYGPIIDNITKKV